jgi:hypothetical protein
MKKISKYNSLWHISVALLAILIAAVVYEVQIPISRLIIKESTDFVVKKRLVNQVETFPDKQTKIEQDIHTIDSLVTVMKSSDEHDQKNFVENLYVYTDSAGLKPSKVEIGEVKTVKDHKEVTVSIKGTGTYEAIGKFSEKIENAHQPVRINQVVIKGIEQNLLSVSIDFVIVE